MQETHVLVCNVLMGALVGFLTVMTIVYFYHKNTSENDADLWKRKCLKSLPIIAVFIGLCALSFQLIVLYPWHIDLNNQLKNLARKTP